MSEPRVRPKDYVFRTALTWGAGGRGVVRSEGKPDIEFAAPLEFGGHGGVWSPEDLQVAALESCILLTFLYFAARAGVELAGYSSTGEGTVRMGADGPSFTAFVVKPRIVVAEEAQVEAARQAVHKAEDACLVSRSLGENVEVSLEAEVSAAGL